MAGKENVYSQQTGKGGRDSGFRLEEQIFYTDKKKEKLEAQRVVNVCSHNALFSCGVSPHILFLVA